MTPNEYQELAMRTNDRNAKKRLLKTLDCKFLDVGGVLNGCLGLSGETGEFCDMVKKSIFHEKAFDEIHAKKELGDCLWYIAMICESLGWNLEEIMQMNIDKLKTRYPDGFDTYNANNRDKNDVLVKENDMCILGDVEREQDERIKRTWKVIYKCRNCGRLFEREAILYRDKNSFLLPTNTVLAPHKCDTGVYGYGDIQASITSRDEDWRDETGSKDYIPQEDD